MKRKEIISFILLSSKGEQYFVTYVRTHLMLNLWNETNVPLGLSRYVMISYYIRDISEIYYIKVCVNNALTYVTYACQMSSI